VRIGQT